MTMLPENAPESKEGACPGITLLQNSQGSTGPEQTSIIETHGTRVWGSEDTVTLNYYGQWGSTDSEFVELNESLEAARLQALGSASTGYKAEWNRGGRTFLVRGRGVSIGGATGVFMSYVLETEGITLYLAAARYPSGYNFNARVTLGSELLMMANGLDRAYPEIRAVLKAVSFTVREERISRIDTAIEIPVSIAAIGEKYQQGGLITRFKQFRLYQGAAGRWEGIQAGTGALVMRIYDKRQELAVTRSESKAAVMAGQRAGWGDECTRVETQLRGEALKKWDCLTYDDWRRLRGPIHEYLLVEHTRLADSCPDRTHTGRYLASALWVDVVNAFRSVCSGGKTTQPAERVERSGAKSELLCKQAVGCLVKALALEQTSQEAEPVTGETIALRFAGLLGRAWHDRDMVHEVNEAVRLVKLAAPSLSRWWSGTGAEFFEPDFLGLTP